MEQNNSEYTEWTMHLKNNKLRARTEEMPQTFNFDSDFEGGNLDMVAKTFTDRIDEYDLILRLDSNCIKH